MSAPLIYTREYLADLKDFAAWAEADYPRIEGFAKLRRLVDDFARVVRSRNRWKRRAKQEIRRALALQRQAKEQIRRTLALQRRVDALSRENTLLIEYDRACSGRFQPTNWTCGCCGDGVALSFDGDRIVYVPSPDVRRCPQDPTCLLPRSPDDPRIREQALANEQARRRHRALMGLS